VGISTGPLVVGPITAVEISAGAGARKEISCSLENTPGDTICSAMSIWVIF
jgi:hypothetical protein